MQRAGLSRLFGLVALHQQRANHVPQAIQLLVKAAKISQTNFVFAEVVEHLERALRLDEQVCVCVVVVVLRLWFCVVVVVVAVLRL